MPQRWSKRSVSTALAYVCSCKGVCGACNLCVCGEVVGLWVFRLAIEDVRRCIPHVSQNPAPTTRELIQEVNILQKLNHVSIRICVQSALITPCSRTWLQCTKCLTLRRPCTLCLNCWFWTCLSDYCTKGL
jgi:hypothetical protein